MPILLFSAEEIAASLLYKMRDVSKQILDLSDLTEKPLDPGESPDARRHKIAKLGKTLAELFAQFDALVQGHPDNAKPAEQTSSAPTDPNPQAN